MYTENAVVAAAMFCRAQVSEKYRKKIELMVRKPDRGEEPAENLLPCPFCQLPGPEGELQCVSCQSLIPFDIATGEGAAVANRASVVDLATTCC